MLEIESKGMPISIPLWNMKASNLWPLIEKSSDNH